jgi:DNA-binding NtrC family response regulator
MTIPSILVVDDQENWRQAAYELLYPEFAVKLANGHDEAIKLLETQSPPFHVIVADIRLVHGDPKNTQGLDVIARAQELGGYTTTIVWTAYAAAETMKRAFQELMVFDYVVKDPRDTSSLRKRFDVGEFVSKVREAAKVATEKQSQAKILVVDDDLTWQRRLSDLLEADGYTVECVSTHSETLDLVRERGHGLLVTELVLHEKPTQYGLEFIEQLKGVCPRTQVIIISDAGNRSTARIAFSKLGVVDFLPKTIDGGFDPREFIQSVRRVYRPSRDLFIVAEFRNSLPDQQLQIGRECIIALSGRRWVSSPETAIPIWLPPYKSTIQIEAVIYVENGDVEITPMPSQIWTLPTRGDIPPLIFGLTPRFPGDYEIQIELYGESGWWRRLERTITVRDNGVR